MQKDFNESKPRPLFEAIDNKEKARRQNEAVNAEKKKNEEEEQYHTKVNYCLDRKRDVTETIKRLSFIFNIEMLSDAQNATKYSSLKTRNDTLYNVMQEQKRFRINTKVLIGLELIVALGSTLMVYRVANNMVIESLMPIDLASLVGIHDSSFGNFFNLYLFELVMLAAVSFSLLHLQRSAVQSPGFARFAKWLVVISYLLLMIMSALGMLF